MGLCICLIGVQGRLLELDGRLRVLLHRMVLEHLSAWLRGIHRLLLERLRVILEDVYSAQSLLGLVLGTSICLILLII